MALDKKLLQGLKDWSIGLTDEKVAEILGDPGPYQVILTFDDKNTVGFWLIEMMKTWAVPPPEL